MKRVSNFNCHVSPPGEVYGFSLVRHHSIRRCDSFVECCPVCHFTSAAERKKTVQYYPKLRSQLHIFERMGMGVVGQGCGSRSELGARMRSAQGCNNLAPIATTRIFVASYGT
eukprot:8634286-Pyramimonas_sp.AAC.1